MGAALERYADCLLHVGDKEKVLTNVKPFKILTFYIFVQAKTVIEEANEINKIIPGTENYYYKKYFLPKYLGIMNCSIK